MQLAGSPDQLADFRQAALLVLLFLGRNVYGIRLTDVPASVPSMITSTMVFASTRPVKAPMSPDTINKSVEKRNIRDISSSVDSLRSLNNNPERRRLIG